METFVKYHGLGNDFVVLDRRGSGVDIDAESSRRYCDRRRGIGADGVLVLLPADPGGAALARMVVHNADGSVAEMCGNGLRCVVKHLAEEQHRAHGGAHPQHKSSPQVVIVDTGAGRLSSQVRWHNREVDEVTVSMGPARLNAPHLPQEPVEIEGVRGAVMPVSMGNPHLVLLDTPPERAAELGPHLERHPQFKERTNVEFVQALQPRKLKVTVWERGVGITPACGTGACAAVVASALKGKSPFGEWVEVELPGGSLFIKASKDLSDVQLRGAVERVYEGCLPAGDDSQPP